MQRFSLPGRPELSLEFDAENQIELGPARIATKDFSRLGYIYQSDAALATYYVEWTPQHPEKDATFDLIVGRWGKDAQAADRQGVSVAFRVLETGPPLWFKTLSLGQLGQVPSSQQP